MGKRGESNGRVGKGKPRTQPYPYEFRIKMVRLYLEEGYSTKWEEYWKQKLGIEGHFRINIASLQLSPCKHF